jgi:hypothetical protein
VVLFYFFHGVTRSRSGKNVLASQENTEGLAPALATFRSSYRWLCDVPSLFSAMAYVLVRFDHAGRSNNYCRGHLRMSESGSVKDYHLVGVTRSSD